MLDFCAAMQQSQKWRSCSCNHLSSISYDSWTLLYHIEKLLKALEASHLPHQLLEQEWINKLTRCRKWWSQLKETMAWFCHFAFSFISSDSLTGCVCVCAHVCVSVWNRLTFLTVDRIITFYEVWLELPPSSGWYCKLKLPPRHNYVQQVLEAFEVTYFRCARKHTRTHAHTNTHLSVLHTLKHPWDKNLTACSSPIKIDSG